MTFNSAMIKTANGESFVPNDGKRSRPVNLAELDKAAIRGA